MLGPTVLFSLCLTLQLIFTVLVLICEQTRYLQHLFDQLDMMAILVAIKMSMTQRRSDQKIRKKMGLSRFNPK